MSQAAKKVLSSRASKPKRTASQVLVQRLVANEIVFAVVGPVGSGTSEIAEALEIFLKDKGFQTKILKAREVIEGWGNRHGSPIPKESKFAETTALQNAGDELRHASGDNAAVALYLIDRIREERAKQQGVKAEKGKPVDPDNTKRAFILDSLRHPAEVALLRSVYQEAFCLIGVVCEEEARKDRLRKKYDDAGDASIDALMHRDENAEEKHGQKVANAFHLADFFVDNTTPRFIKYQGHREKENPEWNVMEEVGRLVDILTHAKIIRPRPNETAMYHAYGARMRSACLSRQVGAALVDRQGNVIATGTNEVPRAGGGVYGGFFIEHSDADLVPIRDHRCVSSTSYCSNTREQNEIIRDMLGSISEFMQYKGNDDLLKRIRKTRIGQLIEFSRAVHAEMDALLSAARQGISSEGTRLFVTTFPCHNCARHIVAAGVDEVQFIEPYLKSRALPLHGDAITTTTKEWRPPSAVNEADLADTDPAPKVLFRPFTGVAPRLYRRAFYKDRELKDDFSGELLGEFGPPDGLGISEALRVSYAQVEAALSENTAEEGS